LTLSLLVVTAGLLRADEEITPENLFNMSIDQLMEVEVASFFRVSTSKAPGYVMTYDLDDIRLGSVRTIADLLELHAPGNIVGAHQRQGRLHGVRGILVDNNAKTLYMRDGQQMNYRSHFGYMVGLLSPMLGDIQAVEIINGPGAILHGSGAINGLINEIPKTGRSHPGAFGRVEYGFREQSYLTEGGYGFQYGDNRDLYVYGGRYGAEGFEPHEDWGYPTAYTRDVDAFGFKDKNYKVSTTWNHDNFNLNLLMFELNPQKNENMESGYFNNSFFAARPKYTVELDADSSLDFIGSFLWMDFADWGANGHPYIQGGSEQHWDLKTVYRTTAIDGHQLAGGFLYGEKRFRDASFYFSADPREGFESLNSKWDEYSVFAEDVIELTDRWTLSAGLRYDKYDLGTFEGQWLPEAYSADPIEGHWSPRIATSYELDDQTVIKASYQHGFRMPDASYYNWNLYNNAAATALGFGNSPSLMPEEMDSYEVNLVKEFSKRMTLNLNLFYNIFKNHLSWGSLDTYWTPAEVAAINAWTPASSWGWAGGMFQNIDGKFQTLGGEAVIDWDITDRTTLIASYGYVEVARHEIEQRYPKHQVKLNLVHELVEKKLYVGLDYLFQSGYDRSMNPVIDSDYEDNRHVVDLFVTYDVSENVRVKGVAKNVFGNDTPPGGFLMDTPSWGNMGYNEPRFYITTEVRF